MQCYNSVTISASSYLMQGCPKVWIDTVDGGTLLFVSYYSNVIAQLVPCRAVQSWKFNGWRWGCFDYLGQQSLSGVAAHSHCIERARFRSHSSFCSSSLIVVVHSLNIKCFHVIIFALIGIAVRENVFAPPVRCIATTRFWCNGGTSPRFLWSLQYTWEADLYHHRFVDAVSVVFQHQRLMPTVINADFHALKSILSAEAASG